MAAVKKAHAAGLKARSHHSDMESAIYSGDYDDYMIDGVETIAWEMGFNGEDLEAVTGWRYGDIPARGRSRNNMDDCLERGVSLMALDGDEMVPAIAAIALGDRPVVRVRGYLSGYGVDGEPLAIGAEVID